MKIVTTKAHKQLLQRAKKGVKRMFLYTIAMLLAAYIGNNISNDLNSYIKFVEAEEDLIIRANPRVDLDENGRLAP